MINKLGTFLLLSFMVINLNIFADENQNTATIPQESMQSAQEDRFVSYTSKQGNFSVDFPEQWEVVEGVMGQDLVAMAPSRDPDDLFLENANIIYARLDSPLKPEDYYHYNMQSLQQLLIDYDLEESADVQLQGRDAKRIIFTHTLGVVNAKVMQYLLLIDDQAYVLTFTADPLDFDKFKASFEKIANTFTIKNNQTL